MAERMSGAAERLADNLSRRKFVAWIGAGGAALAAGLGLDRLRPAAFAAGVACPRIQLAPITTPSRRIFCAPPGQCVPQSADRFCEREYEDACAQGLHCSGPTRCRAVGPRPTTDPHAPPGFAIRCHAQGRPGERGCPHGEGLCQCDLFFPEPGGALRCRCECR